MMIYDFDIRNTMDIPDIEQKNVVDVYSVISTDFDRTRYKVWPGVKKFIESFPEDTNFLEVGCGNGKNMLVRPKKFEGCDICEKFVEICKKKDLSAQVADAAKLPYDDNTFDVSMSVAALHHLSNDERRIKALNEMFRVTKDKGTVFVEVWAFEDNSKAEEPDTMVTWKYKGNVYDRYYHFFKKQELLDLVSKVPGFTVESIHYEKYNWVIVMNVTKN